jgi:putative ABC transport system permease protein
MNGAIDISWAALASSAVLLVPPILVLVVFRIRQLQAVAVGVVRMAVQLFLVGLLLVYLFDLNSTLLNIAWFLLMIVVAAGTVVSRSSLRLRALILPAFVSLLVAGTVVLLYFTGVMLRLENIVDARYFIALGGMMVGNSLRGNVVALGNFYNGVRRDESRYLFRLAAGATRLEALMPGLRASIEASLAPTIATMATTGIVFLPGMMTGQILGGSSPLVAVKYQIAIMVAIFSAVSLSTTLCLLLSIPTAFDAYGMLRRSVFSSRKRKPSRPAGRPQRQRG